MKFWKLIIPLLGYSSFSFLSFIIVDRIGKLFFRIGVNTTRKILVSFISRGELNDHVISTLFNTTQQIKEHIYIHIKLNMFISLVIYIKEYDIIWPSDTSTQNFGVPPGSKLGCCCSQISFLHVS